MEKLQDMHLHLMLRSFRESFGSGIQNKFTADEMIAHLIDAEWDEQDNRKFNNLIRKAAFRYKATIDEIDFKPLRKLDTAVFYM